MLESKGIPSTRYKQTNKLKTEGKKERRNPRCEVTHLILGLAFPFMDDVRFVIFRQNSELL